MWKETDIKVSFSFIISNKTVQRKFVIIIWSKRNEDFENCLVHQTFFWGLLIFIITLYVYFLQVVKRVERSLRAHPFCQTYWIKKPYCIENVEYFFQILWIENLSIKKIFNKSRAIQKCAEYWKYIWKTSLYLKVLCKTKILMKNIKTKLCIHIAIIQIYNSIF